MNKSIHDLNGTTKKEQLPTRVAGSIHYTDSREITLPHGALGGTTENLKDETIRSTSMSPIRKRNYVLATVFDGGVKDRRNEKKKNKALCFEKV